MTPYTSTVFVFLNNPEFKWEYVEPSEMVQVLEEPYLNQDVHAPHVWLGGGSDINTDGNDVVDYVSKIVNTCKRLGILLSVNVDPYLSFSFDKMFRAGRG